MISVVLPVYNGEKFLSQSIESIIAQTYRDWELIIVDDCSTDNTYSIANRYKKIDNRIHVYRNDVNKKLPGSLNVGFKYAKGDYYTWTSDDNMYLPDALNEMLLFLKDNKDVELVSTDIEIIDESGQHIKNMELEEPTREEFLKRNVMGACFLYKREVHEKLNGYDENLFLVEDYDFWLRATRYYKIGRIRKVHYKYRAHSKSLTETRREDASRLVLELLSREFEYEPQTIENSIKKYMILLEYSFFPNMQNVFREYLKELKKLSRKEYRKLEHKYRLAAFLPIYFVLVGEDVLRNGIRRK